MSDWTRVADTGAGARMTAAFVTVGLLLLASAVFVGAVGAVLL